MVGKKKGSDIHAAGLETVPSGERRSREGTESAAQAVERNLVNAVTQWECESARPKASSLGVGLLVLSLMCVGSLGSWRARAHPRAGALWGASTEPQRLFGLVESEDGTVSAAQESMRKVKGKGELTPSCAETPPHPEPEQAPRNTPGLTVPHLRTGTCGTSTDKV